MSKDGEKSGWKEYIWNPRTREFLGRTASSWGEYSPATAMQQTQGSVNGSWPLALKPSPKAPLEDLKACDWGIDCRETINTTLQFV